MMTYWTNIILFGIKLLLILNKKLITNLFTIKNIWRLKSYSDEATCFQDKEVPKIDFCLTCLAVIPLDSIFKRHEKYYP